MSQYLFICLLLFVLLFILSIKLFSKQINDSRGKGNSEIKKWKNVAGKSAFYRIAVLACMLIAALIAYLLKVLIE